jgi:hypothetical protein
MDAVHRRSDRTDDAVDWAILDCDCNAVLDTIEDGGVAIIPTCLTYAIIGHRAEAIGAIFAAKARSYSKPCGVFGSPSMSRELHALPAEKHEIACILKEEEDLPFSIVAPFRRSHPLLADVDSFVIDNASKDGTMDYGCLGRAFCRAACRALHAAQHRGVRLLREPFARRQQIPTLGYRTGSAGRGLPRPRLRCFALRYRAWAFQHDHRLPGFFHCARRA